ncbi:hypothetical protein D3C81_1613860 [compost metagenome]
MKTGEQNTIHPVLLGEGVGFGQSLLAHVLDIELVEQQMNILSLGHPANAGVQFTEVELRNIRNDNAECQLAAFEIGDLRLFR